MLHFVCTFSILRAQGVRLIVIEKVQNYGKVLFIKNMFENDGGWMHPPLLELITMSLTIIHYANQPIWLQYDVGQILTQLC